MSAAPPESEEVKVKGLGAFVPIPVEDDAYYKKWSGLLLIGPYVVAILALIIIFTGQNVIVQFASSNESCGYPLDSVIQIVIVCCYLFLLTYFWIFFGDTVTINIDKPRVILTPYKSFTTIVILYLIVGIITFIVFCVGGYLLQSATFCATTAPMLYSYSSFIIAIFFITFIIVVTYLISTYFADTIKSQITDKLKGPTIADVEERLFKTKFGELDPDKKGKIPRDKLSTLLTNLGIYVPEKELSDLAKTLDPNDTDSIDFDKMAAWFKKLNESPDEDGGVDKGKNFLQLFILTLITSLFFSAQMTEFFKKYKYSIVHSVF